MKYMGSKNRHAKEILSIILRERERERERESQQLYVEPFVGGANLIDKVSGPRLAADIDIDLITLWQAVSEGWMPPENISEIEYHNLKSSPSSPLKGYAAFCMSYCGKKWGGYAGKVLTKTGKIRNYPREARNALLKQASLLRNVKFICSSYDQLEIPNGSLVYCDPPYNGTTKYKTGTDFNHDDFWVWVRKLSLVNQVFVSEYAAPADFKCIWEKQVNSSLTQDTGSKRNVERLWQLNR